MSDRRLAIGGGHRRLVLKQERFFPAGTYTWSVPPGCESVDVFLVGGGGRGGRYMNNGNGGGGGGGYTKTFKADTSGWRDGGAVSVTAGTSIQIVVGKGAESEQRGGYSQFLNSSYRALGGYSVKPGPGNTFEHYHGANGGSGGAGDAYSPTDTNVQCEAGSDGSSGVSVVSSYGDAINGGTGQRHTTRDFGEPTGKRNAGGGDARRCKHGMGISDYTKGSGGDCISADDTQGYIYGVGGGGYGGGGGAGSAGGDGTVLIRYYAYE